MFVVLLGPLNLRMRQIIETLTQALPGLSPQMRRAGALVLDNPGAIAVNSMRAMASEASVSPPTMLRLAQRLGFGSYKDFRAVFKRSIAGTEYRTRAVELRSATEREGISGLVNSTADAAARGIDRFHDPAFIRDVERVADLMLNAGRTFLLAAGSCYGQIMTFQYVVRMALPTVELMPISSATLGENFAIIGSDDLVVGVSIFPYTRHVVDAVRLAAARGIHIAAVTDQRSSPLAQAAEASIVVSTRNAHFFPSTISISAAFEALSAVIAVKGAPASLETISAFEDTLNLAKAYWTDQE
jgi:DNA-binding MurR/RpiR family transcriptional regulator